MAIERPQDEGLKSTKVIDVTVGPKPAISNRSQWKAASPRSRSKLLGFDGVVIHWPGANVGNVTSARAPAVLRSIQNQHLQRGLSDFPYNWAVDQDGRIWEGRGQGWQNGAHNARVAPNANRRNEAILLLVSLDGKMSNAMREACVKLCAWRGGSISGHRDWDATQCPGVQVHAWLPQLRRDVAKVTKKPVEEVDWNELARVVKGLGEDIARGNYIRRGERSNRVKFVQNAIGVNADGIFGPATEAALRSFQRSNRLSADAIVGPATWNAMYPSAPPPAQGVDWDAVARAIVGIGQELSARRYIRQGERSDRVRFVQNAVNVAEDGIFGPQTLNAVRSFQRAHGLTVDGIVGITTWRAMYPAQY